MRLFKNLTKNLRYQIEKYLDIEIKLINDDLYKNIETPNFHSINYLAKSKGVLHIGAHRGSERYAYDWFGKSVIWIEANPVIFKELRKNLREFRFQNCYQGLLHSKNNLILDFFLSTNDQASSSIYDFSKKFKEKKIFFQDKKRKIEMYDKIKLKTITLDNLISLQKLNLENFNHWVVDVQGAELEVLKGAKNSLKFCRSITIEVSTENFYENGSTYSSIKEYLNTLNFKVLGEPTRNHEDIIFVTQ